MDHIAQSIILSAQLDKVYVLLRRTLSPLGGPYYPTIEKIHRHKEDCLLDLSNKILLPLHRYLFSISSPKFEDLGDQPPYSLLTDYVISINTKITEKQLDPNNNEDADIFFSSLDNTEKIELVTQILQAIDNLYNHTDANYTHLSSASNYLYSQIKRVVEYEIEEWEIS